MSLISAIVKAFNPLPARAGIQHDYRWGKRGWGHDLIFKPTNGGLQATASGWGKGISVGDSLILSHGRGPLEACYRVDEIEYYWNPRDMWHAKLSFSPRKVPHG